MGMYMLPTVYGTLTGVYTCTWTTQFHMYMFLLPTHRAGQPGGGGGGEGWEGCDSLTVVAVDGG